jgi:hypothetical protein
MLVGAKLLVKGKQSLQAVPHVIAGSTASSYPGRFARYLLHPKLSFSRSVSWVRNETIKRTFSTTNGNPREDSHGSAAVAKDLPLYRPYFLSMLFSLQGLD